MWVENKNFGLNIYFTPQEMSPYMKVHDRYIYDQLEDIFYNTDVLIAPSIWYETFGYTVLEALSYGVPVIVSDHVGAKDIIPNGCGIVIEDMNVNKLQETIQSLDMNDLEKMNQNILDKAKIITIEQMTEEIMKRCY